MGAAGAKLRQIGWWLWLQFYGYERWKQLKNLGAPSSGCLSLNSTMVLEVFDPRENKTMKHLTTACQSSNHLWFTLAGCHSPSQIDCQVIQLVFQILKENWQNLGSKVFQNLPKATPRKDLWPLPYRQDRVELRVILHEAAAEKSCWSFCRVKSWSWCLHFLVPTMGEFNVQNAYITFVNIAAVQCFCWWRYLHIFHVTTT